MKKTISAVLLILITTGIFYSCSKKNDNVATPITHIATQPTITKDQFLKYMEEKKPTHTTKQLPRWLKKILADLKGWMQQDQNFGEMIDCASEYSSMAGFPPPGGWGANQFKGIGPSNNWTGAANGNNPYESYGILHNKVLYALVTNPFNYYIDGSTDEACNLDYSKLASLISTTCSTNMTTETAKSYADFFYNTLPNQTSMQDYLHNNNKIDDFVYGTFSDYISTISSFSNSSDLVSYSIGVENQLMASDASETDKQRLLSAFCIARYSATFWDSCGN